MKKGALLTVAGFLGFCVSLSAQEMPRPGQIQPGVFTLNPLGPGGAMDTRPTLGQTHIALSNACDDLPSLTLADRRLFSFPRCLRLDGSNADA